MKTQRKIERHLNAAMSYLSFGTNATYNGRPTEFELKDDDSHKWREVIKSEDKTYTPEIVENAKTHFRRVIVQARQDGKQHFQDPDNHNLAISVFTEYLREKYSQQDLDYELMQIIASLPQVAEEIQPPDAPYRPKKRARLSRPVSQFPDLENPDLEPVSRGPGVEVLSPDTTIRGPPKVRRYPPAPPGLEED